MRGVKRIAGSAIDTKTPGPAAWKIQKDSVQGLASDVFILRTLLLPCLRALKTDQA
jgi:hypothetical protein